MSPERAPINVHHHDFDETFYAIEGELTGGRSADRRASGRWAVTPARLGHQS